MTVTAKKGSLIRSQPKTVDQSALTALGASGKGGATYPYGGVVLNATPHTLLRNGSDPTTCPTFSWVYETFHLAQDPPEFLYPSTRGAGVVELLATDGSIYWEPPMYFRKRSTIAKRPRVVLIYEDAPIGLSPLEADIEAIVNEFMIPERILTIVRVGTVAINLIEAFPKSNGQQFPGPFLDSFEIDPDSFQGGEILFINYMRAFEPLYTLYAPQIDPPYNIFDHGQFRAGVSSTLTGAIYTPFAPFVAHCFTFTHPTALLNDVNLSQQGIKSLAKYQHTIFTSGDSEYNDLDNPGINISTDYAAWNSAALGLPDFVTVKAIDPLNIRTQLETEIKTFFGVGA